MDWFEFVVIFVLLIYVRLFELESALRLSTKYERLTNIFYLINYNLVHGNSNFKLRQR